MDEKLNLIESGLYKSELTFPHLKEHLLSFGEIKAWYKYYRGGNQWAGKHFHEETLFLMTKVIIWCRISEDGHMLIHSFKLDEITKSDRNYVFPNKKSQDTLMLSEVTLTFTAMKDKMHRDDLLLRRPRLEEMGDVEGFENFVRLLDI